MSFEFLVQAALEPAREVEVSEVRALASTLDAEIHGAHITEALASIPEIGGSSHAVDAIVTPLARRLGFESQKKNLFANYQTRLRPDWFRPLGAGGVLLEIERGKTLTNNMDLLDLWKCHICREAHHLFLVMPLRVTRSYGIETTYNRVVTRMRTFVEPANKVDVATISVFGY